jgi:hypothetical protein
MAQALETIVRSLEHWLAAAEPQQVTPARAADLVKLFVKIELLGAAGKVLYADRAASSGAWADEGHLDASSWLANLSKASLGEAISTMETSKALGELPDTADALRRGALSGSQLKEVARGASQDPSAERELLELAGKDTLKRLQERARQMRPRSASKEDEAARYLAVRRHRYLRHFVDHQDAVRIEARLPKDEGARVVAALQAEADAVFREARRAGKPERSEAYRADALVALVTGTARTGPAAPGTGKRSGSRRDTVLVMVDGRALKRGYAKSGETCEIAGVGTVAVASVDRLLPTAFVKTVITDGVDVLNVCHIGRTVPAHVETALDVRDPVCVVPAAAGRSRAVRATGSSGRLQRTIRASNAWKTPAEQ